MIDGGMRGGVPRDQWSRVVLPLQPRVGTSTFSAASRTSARRSLPLPRAVGVAADEELLGLRVFDAEGFPLGEEKEAVRLAWQDRVRTDLTAVLVPGLEIREVRLMKSTVSFHPVSAQYGFVLASVEGLREKIADLLAKEHLVMDRVAPGRRGERCVDVRAFLKSIRLDSTQVIVECGISDAGSIRVDEIMTLLEIAPADLTAPIQRTEVAWKIT